jgi:hypothetical protein
MEKLFYELIRVSAGQLDCLSRGPEPEEWQVLYEMARQQQLTGVCYHGAQALFEFGLRVPHELIIDWMAEAEEIEEQNAMLTQRCVEVQKLLSESGFKSSVLAGQGIAHDYGETLQSLRQPDGIDMYVDGEEGKLRVFLMAWNEKDARLHARIGLGKNPYRNKLLKPWFEKNHRALFVKDGELTRPSVSMTFMYSLITLYWRFIYQGITLRDLMDCFFALKRVAGYDKAAAINYEKVLNGLGLLHFSQGVMWVMQEVFGLEEKAQIVKPLESKGSFILQEVMSGKRNILHLLPKYPIDSLCSFIP